MSRRPVIIDIDGICSYQVYIYKVYDIESHEAENHEIPKANSCIYTNHKEE